MSQMHPELIFVAGPQAGQRVVLSRPVAMLGRGGDADILFSEEFISRDQARYELLHAGPTLENLSNRGTWINGKRYKTGKRVLLETGDLIGAGQETQVLFVSAGDDPDTALATYRESAVTGKDAFGRKAKPPEQPPPPPDLIESEPATEQDEQPDEAEFAEKRPSEMSAAERLENEQKARRKKIIIGLGIYLAAIIAIAIALKVRSGGKEPPWPIPPKLTNNEIADFIRAPIKGITPIQLREEEELKEAEGLYQQYGLSDTYRLYDCLVAFKKALAYSDKSYFDDPKHGFKHGRMYNAVLDKLTKTIQKKYENAYFLEKAEEWERAEREFFDILRIYRNQSDGLFKNIQAHYKRVKHFQQKGKPKKRRMFGR
ncbi:MAG: FHA domain-containing protein [Phycisphaerae bacterium]|nr:FHA domain-containing protein [Phycisphaerae bacterium]